MANPAFFKASTHSRLPRLHIDYDSGQHRYTPTYLNPNGYDILLDAFPGVEEVIVSVINNQGNGKEEKIVKRQRLKIPSERLFLCGFKSES